MLMHIWGVIVGMHSTLGLTYFVAFVFCTYSNWKPQSWEKIQRYTMWDFTKLSLTNDPLEGVVVFLSADTLPSAYIVFFIFLFFIFLCPLVCCISGNRWFLGKIAGCCVSQQLVKYWCFRQPKANETKQPTTVNLLKCSQTTVDRLYIVCLDGSWENIF